MKLIVHIGGEKTGTTSIQSAMTKCASKLRSQGILWPTDPRCFYRINHGPLVACFRQDQRSGFLPSGVSVPTTEEARDLLGELAQTGGCDRMVLSAEWFSSRFDKESIAAFKRALPPIETEILYYARRQDDLLVALFFTGIMTGRATWFDINKINKKNRVLNHHSVLSDWADVFGSENITVVDYGAASRHDSVLEFFTRIGYSAPGYESVRLNTSGTLPIVRLLYLLNCHVDPRTEQGKGEASDFVFEHSKRLQRISQLLRKRAERWSKPPLKCLLSSAEREQIMAMFEDGNLALDEMFGLKLPWHVRSAGDRVREPEEAPALPSDQSLLAAAVLDLSEPREQKGSRFGLAKWKAQEILPKAVAMLRGARGAWGRER